MLTEEKCDCTFNTFFKISQYAKRKTKTLPFTVTTKASLKIFSTCIFFTSTGNGERLDSTKHHRRPYLMINNGKVHACMRDSQPMHACKFHQRLWSMTSLYNPSLSYRMFRRLQTVLTDPPAWCPTPGEPE